MSLSFSSLARRVSGRIAAWRANDAETRRLWQERELRGRSSETDFEGELALLDRNSICIDLGANVGDVTERLAAVAGHVHAFEPDPWAFDQLERRARSWDNVTLHRKAMGAAAGTATFFRDPKFDEAPGMRSQGTSAFHSILWRGKGEPFEVEVVGIEAFLSSLDRDVALIKMDIEGGEVAILEALLGSPSAKRIGAIFAETHECQIRELRRPIADLRRRATQITAPRLYLDWH